MRDAVPATFEEMLAAAGIVRVGADVKPAAFPLDPAYFDDRHLQVVGFDGRLSAKEAIHGLESRGFVPARPEHLLAYLARFKRGCERYVLVALGLIGKVRHGKHVALRAYESDGALVLESKPLSDILETTERTLVVHPA